MSVYPHCQEAVDFHEVFFVLPTEGLLPGFPTIHSALLYTLRTRQMKIEELLHMLKESMSEVRGMPGSYNLAKIRQEMDHPSFRQYLAAKFGLL